MGKYKTATTKGATIKHKCISHMCSNATSWLQQLNTNSSFQFPALQRVQHLFALWADKGRPGAEPPHNSHTKYHLSTPQHCLQTAGHGWIYVIVGLKQPQHKYVGWTKQNLTERFWQHATEQKRHDNQRSVLLQSVMQREGVHNFVIFGLERVTLEKAVKGSGYIVRQRRREQTWLNYLHALHPEGLNTIRVIRYKRHSGSHTHTCCQSTSLRKPKLHQQSRGSAETMECVK